MSNKQISYVVMTGHVIDSWFDMEEKEPCYWGASFTLKEHNQKIVLEGELCKTFKEQFKDGSLVILDGRLYNGLVEASTISAIS